MDTLACCNLRPTTPWHKSALFTTDQHQQLVPTEMSDMDMFSAMGIVGFGKAAKKRELDPKRFDKSKREEVAVSLIFFRVLSPLIFFIHFSLQNWR